ncbi:MAG: hypothetical protein V7L26_04220 [Nostoc sp.]|uniref:hypothetical protein n=1 Tax=Nostoc sp. TaxID=1180 RepID=UPI002FF34C37
MYITTQKEEFSYAYINAIASAAGYSFQIAPRPFDLVGVDITITGLLSTENQTTVTVYLPRQNIFSVEALIALMQQIASGEPI